MTRPPLTPDAQSSSPEPASAPVPPPTGAEPPRPGHPESPLATQLPAWDLLPPSAFVRRNIAK